MGTTYSAFHQRERSKRDAVLRVGVAKSRATGAAVLYHQVIVRLSTKFRVWWVAGDDRFIDYDPSEWRTRFEVVASHKTDASQRPS